MKTAFLLFSILFALGNQVSSAQNKTLSCQDIQQKLGKDKMLQLYWTEKMGEFLLAHPEVDGIRPRQDSVPFAKAQVKSSYYTFATFAFIVYNREFDIACNENDDILMHTRFMSRKDWNTELHDSQSVRTTYFKLSGEKEFEPSPQDLDELCKQFSH